MIKHILRLHSCIAGFCLLTANLFGAAGEVSPEGFFEAEGDFGASLPADAIYPEGRELMFTFFSVGGGTEEESMKKYPEETYQALLKEYKDAGFTVLGPSYELDDRLLGDAEEHDMKVIYTVGIPMNFHSKEPLEFTPEEIKKTIGEQVSAVANNERIVWWYLIPEELRYWRKNELGYLQAATEAIRENDPKGRPIYMYEPNHRDAKALAKTSEYLDIVGKGMYTDYAVKWNERAWNRWSMQQETLAEEAVGRDLIVLSLPGMFTQPPEDTLQWIDAWVRHDVILSLVDGAEGIMVFSLRRRPDFEAHAQYYEAYKKLAPLVMGEDGLGQVYLFGEKRDDLTLDILSGPDTVEVPPPGPASKDGPLTYPSVVLDNRIYKGKRYITLVNSSDEAVEVVVGGIPYMTLVAHDVLSDAPEFSVVEGEIMAALPPFGVSVFELSLAK